MAVLRGTHAESSMTSACGASHACAHSPVRIDLTLNVCVHDQRARSHRKATVLAVGLVLTLRHGGAPSQSLLRSTKTIESFTRCGGSVTRDGGMASSPDFRQADFATARDTEIVSALNRGRLRGIRVGLGHTAVTWSHREPARQAIERSGDKGDAQAVNSQSGDDNRRSSGHRDRRFT